MKEVPQRPAEQPSLYSRNDGKPIVMRRCFGKYRLKEIRNPLVDKPYWRIEKKHWLGFWYQPSLTYAENATFYKRHEAERWFNYLIGKTKVEEVVIAGYNGA